MTKEEFQQALAEEEVTGVSADRTAVYDLFRDALDDAEGCLNGIAFLREGIPEDNPDNEPELLPVTDARCLEALSLFEHFCLVFASEVKKLQERL